MDSLIASPVVDQETEDMTHCGICFSPFDDSLHKPKFLSCHHTFCVSCIKAIKRNREASFPCPSCRKVTSCAAGEESSVLENNRYVLQMLVNKNQNRKETSSLRRVSVKDRWCLSCKKEATGHCILSANHVTLSMDSNPSESCIDLQNSKDNNEAQLNFIIERRKQIKSHFQHVFQTLTGGLKNLDEDNDNHLVQMTSLMEDAVIRKDETLTSSIEMVGKCAEMLKLELADVDKLEKSFLSLIDGADLHLLCLPSSQKQNVEEKILKIEPENELTFKGPFEKPVSVFIKLTNTTCKKVCYKMKTTVPERFCVKPPFGTIDPKGAATITVTLQSFGSDRNDLEAKFQVLSAITPEGKYSFDTMFGKESGLKINKWHIKCMLEFPEEEQVNHTAITKIDPENELRFKGPFNEPVSAVMKLTNTTTKKVCFEVKTISPEGFCSAKPLTGTIDPKGAVTITVTLQMIDSKDLNEKTKLQVLSAIVPPGDYNIRTLLNWSSQKIDTWKLNCVLELP